jgi:hypothetical protein
MDSDDDELTQAKVMSSSSSADEEEFDTVQVIFKKIYVDPLQDIIDYIDADAANILRTGKLTVHGEAGDMDILQPLLFSLQAKESDIPVLIPQLMQNPFFIAKEDALNIATTSADALLSNGCIRLGVVIDQIIYELLSTHCCKGPGSRQADTFIETALKTTYFLPNALERFQAAYKNPPPLVPSGYTTADSPNKELRKVPEITSDDEFDDEEDVLDMIDEQQMATYDYDDSRHKKLSSGVSSCSSSGFSRGYSGSIDASSGAEGIHQPFDMPYLRPRAHSVKTQPQQKTHKKSYPNPLAQRQSINSSTSSITSILQDSNNWHASLPLPKDMIVGSFGDNSYPILIWNPEMKASFKIGTKNRLTSSITVEVDNPKDLLNLKVYNTVDHKIGFSIRAYRQSMMHRSHVIYPKAGLHILDPRDEFVVEAEMFKGEETRDEYFCIDLLICALNSKPSWNIQRRYAILKQNQSQHKVVQRISRGSPLLPGTFKEKDLGNSLRQVILHGLQSVVKNKLDEAEIIFTQAIQLPMFQRVPLKAFAYICLAVVANKRRKKGESTNKVGHVLKLVNSMDKLVEACESAPNMRMPKMIALIKQLKKELNPAKVIKEHRKSPKPQVSLKNEVSKEVNVSGDGMDLYNISLLIPGGALPQSSNITLSHMNQDQIHHSIQSSMWSSMLTILGAISIQGNPLIEHFKRPIIVTIILPENTKPTGPLRLLQSNYMTTWIDVTDDPSTELSIDQNGRLTIRTDQAGWLVVASLELDIAKIMPVAVKSVFSEEQIVLHVNAFGLIFPDDTTAQIAVFITPQNSKEDSSTTRDVVTPPPGHRPISFPHSINVSKGQKIRVEIQGKFEADIVAGQTDLFADIKVDGVLGGIIEKTVQLSPGTEGLYGKLLISTYCMSHRTWEKIQEINLSSAAANSYSNNN